MVTISGETLTYHQLSWRSTLISITWTWSGTRTPSLSQLGITSTCWKTLVRHALMLSEVLWLIIRPISSCFIPSYTSVLLTHYLVLKMVLKNCIRNFLFLKLYSWYVLFKGTYPSKMVKFFHFWFYSEIWSLGRGAPLGKKIMVLGALETPQMGGGVWMVPPIGQNLKVCQFYWNLVIICKI